jgi:hypothetical protein
MVVAVEWACKIMLQIMLNVISNISGLAILFGDLLQSSPVLCTQRFLEDVRRIG